MIAFSNLHILSIKHGEVYVHHFWLLFLIVMMAFGQARSWGK
jgi:hypothetical protein